MPSTALIEAECRSCGWLYTLSPQERPKGDFYCGAPCAPPPPPAPAPPTIPAGFRRSERTGLLVKERTWAGFTFEKRS